MPSPERHRGDRPPPGLLLLRILGIAGASGLLWLTSVTIASIQPPPVDLDGRREIPVEPPARPAGDGGGWLEGRLPPPPEPADPALEARPAAAPPWQVVRVRRGESLERLFRRLGLEPRQAHLLAAHPEGKRLHRLRAGQRLRLLRTGGRLERLELELGLGQRLVAQRGPEGFSVRRVERALERRLHYATGRIRHSLFDAALAAGLSDRLVLDLVAIFGWDVDFALDLRQGDRFSVVYEGWYDRRGRKLADGRILAAEFVNRGRRYRAIGQPDEAGRMHYYTPAGASLRRAFLRSPLRFTRISSRFTSGRYHPVLKRWRAHRGVDYAAPRGTPVRSTADGRVAFVGRKGGYGRTVIIRHGGRYSTLYAHLRGYARGLRRGQRIRQGDLVGYVGSSGLATGPHLHYEFRINGVHRNPLTVKHPRARHLAGEPRRRFLAAASRWQAVLDRLAAPARVALGAGTGRGGSPRG